MPLFKHGLDEQGLVSTEQVAPEKYLYHRHKNLLAICENPHKPFCEQFPKQLFVSIVLVNKSTS